MKLAHLLALRVWGSNEVKDQNHPKHTITVSIDVGVSLTVDTVVYNLQDRSHGCYVTRLPPQLLLRRSLGAGVAS